MIRIDKKLIAYESTCMDTIDPKYHRPEDGWLDEYFRRNPFPVDSSYSKDDFIYDITQSTGFLSFPGAIKQETIEYVSELLNELL